MYNSDTSETGNATPPPRRHALKTTRIRPQRRKRCLLTVFLELATEPITIIALGFGREELHVLKSILYHASVQNRCEYRFVDNLTNARLAFINAENQELVEAWVNRKKQGLALPGVMVCDNQRQTRGEPSVKRPLSLRKIVEVLTLAASKKNPQSQ